VAATCRLAGLAITNAIVRNPSMVMVAYGLPIGAILYSLIVLKRSERQRSGVGMVSELVDAFEKLWTTARSRLGRNRTQGAVS